jgi:hypothetical protein
LRFATNHFAKSRRRRFFWIQRNARVGKKECGAKNIPKKQFIFLGFDDRRLPTSGRRFMPASSDRMKRSKMPLPLPAFRSTNP